MSTTSPTGPDALEQGDRGISARDLDTACVALSQHVRTQRKVSEAELRAATPTDHADPYAWLSFYGQLRAWMAMPDPAAEAASTADSVVTAAIREAPMPVPDVPGWSVYPKSFEAMLQLQVLDTQLDRLTARLVTMLAEGSSLEEVDGAVDLSTCVAYVVCLITWAWTYPSTGLPFAATEAEPTVPESVRALTPAQLLSIARAANSFTQSIAACQALVDPTPARDSGRRPSWAGFFEAVGAEMRIDPRELAVTHSIGKVLAIAALASDRRRAGAAAADDL